MVYYCSTSAADDLGNLWIHFCLGVSRPQHVVICCLSLTLEILSLSQLVTCIQSCCWCPAEVIAASRKQHRELQLDFLPKVWTAALYRSHKLLRFVHLLTAERKQTRKATQPYRVENDACTRPPDLSSAWCDVYLWPFISKLLWHRGHLP